MQFNAYHCAYIQVETVRQSVLQAQKHGDSTFFTTAGGSFEVLEHTVSIQIYWTIISRLTVI